MNDIPFTQPYVPPLSVKNIEKALKERVQQGDGMFSAEVVSKIESIYPDFTCLLVPSCTSALELSMMLINLGPGDEVIVPSYTFPSAATAVTKFWATPVFCDIDFRTGCIDVELLEGLIGEKTKAITWVNYGGNTPNLSVLRKLSQKYKLTLIEDAAHCFGVSTDVDFGLTGDLVTFSFHATKNIQCGEGGALLIRKSNLVSRARIMREKGTNRHDFALGKVDKYKWIDRGSSYLLAEINSALLSAQLDAFGYIQSSRQNAITTYLEKLAPHLPKHWTLESFNLQSAHLLALIAPSKVQRDHFIFRMSKKSVTTVSHYEDLASSLGGKTFGKKSIKCRKSIELSQRIVRLPVYTEMAKTDIERVIQSAIEVFSEK